MKRKFINCSSLALALSIFSSMASAEPIFHIREAKILPGKRSVSSTPQEGASRQRKKPMVLAIHLELINNSSNKKLTLSDPFKVSLKDEFGNYYRKLKAPQNYSGPLVIAPPSFPSLYPYEAVQKVVFFEAPLHSAKQLLLTVSAPGVGLDKNLQLKIAREDIRNSLIKYSKRTPEEDEVKISSPQEGEKFRPGDLVPIQIDFSQRIPKPDSFYVLSPLYIGEDRYQAYRYDLRLPSSQPLGDFTFVVMAKWSDPDKQETTISKSVTIRVVDKENYLAP